MLCTSKCQASKQRITAVLNVALEAKEPARESTILEREQTGRKHEVSSASYFEFLSTKFRSWALRSACLGSTCRASFALASFLDSKIAFSVRRHVYPPVAYDLEEYNV